MPSDAPAVDELDPPYRLIDLTAPLAERLARLPVLRSMIRRLLAVLDEVLG